MGETIGEEGSVREAGGRRETSREHHTAQRAVTASQPDGQARKDMLGACRDSRHAGKLVEKLAENLAVQVTFLYTVDTKRYYTFLFLDPTKVMSESRLTFHIR